MVELATAAALVILGPGALAPADAGVLEGVADLRLRYGFGLSEAAPAGTVLVAVESCEYLGRTGHALVAGIGWVDVFVVDCQQRAHRPLSELGIVADVNDVRLAHRRAKIWLQ